MGFIVVCLVEVVVMVDGEWWWMVRDGDGWCLAVLAIVALIVAGSAWAFERGMA